MPGKRQGAREHHGRLRPGLACRGGGDTPSRLTNEQLINKIVFEQTGIPLDDPAIADMICCYERTVVPRMGGGIVRAQPMPGAREAVDCVHDLGLVCALATNPVVSHACDVARLHWAGFDEGDFALISCAENSTRSKPWAGYYEEFCGKLGVSSDECLIGWKRRPARLCPPRVRPAHHLRGPRPPQARHLERPHVRPHAGPPPPHRH